MAVPGAREALRLGGDLNFSDGGIYVKDLIGTFIKSVAFANGVWTLTFQDAAGNEMTADIPPGWVVSSTEPTSPAPYAGQGWYDTTASLLKIYDGSSFIAVSGAVRPDGSVAFTAPVAGVEPTLDAHLVTKAYVDALVEALSARIPDPVGTYERRAAVSSNALLTTGDISAGTTTNTQIVVMPTWTTGPRFLFIGVPDAEGDITDIRVGGFDNFDNWVRVAGTTDGYKWWRTIVNQSQHLSGQGYSITEA